MSHFPDVGDHAVDFTLPSTRGDITLSSTLRNGAVLLVFYPQDDTLVCTRQLCNYRDNLSLFEDLDVQIIALNDESLEKHNAFAGKYGFPFPLASDTERKVCQAYGGLVETFKAKRLLVLVGEDGRVWWRHAELRLFRRSAEELHRIIEQLWQEH